MAGEEMALDAGVDVIDERPPLDVTKALRLRINKHLSYSEIGQLLGGYNKQTVHKALQPFLNMIADPEARQAYKDNKADVLEGVQLKVVSNLVDPARLKKASVNNLAYAAGQLDNMIRLERGQATEHVAYKDVSRHESEIDKQLEEIESKLAILQGNTSSSDTDDYL